MKQTTIGPASQPESEDSTTKTIIATFAARGFAKEAETHLAQAGLSQVTIDVEVTPEQVEAISTANPSMATANPAAMPSAVATTALAPVIAETLEANATARLTVRVPASRLAEAAQIIKAASGNITDELAQTAQTASEELAEAT